MAAEYIENLASLSTIAALLISGHQIYMHLTNYKLPGIQLFILRILFMIPVRQLNILIT